MKGKHEFWWSARDRTWEVWWEGKPLIDGHTGEVARVTEGEAVRVGLALQAFDRLREVRT